jgi:hypothetical protein
MSCHILKPAGSPAGFFVGLKTVQVKIKPFTSQQERERQSGYDTANYNGFNLLPKYGWKPHAASVGSY